MDAKHTPMRAVRGKCLDCSGGSATEVRLCTVNHCPLWPYRFGRRPRIDSEEARVHVAMGKLTLEELTEVEPTRKAIQSNVQRSRALKMGGG